jgi:hypothetical protein
MQFGYGYVSYGGLSGPGIVTLEVPEDGCWCRVIDVEASVGLFRSPRPT